MVQSVPNPLYHICCELTASDPSSYGTSYQSGGTVSDPTAIPQAYSNDPESAAFGGPSGPSGSSGDAERANAWESRFGWRVDFMAAAAYLGGPITGMLASGQPSRTKS
jgi:hypothetical protein